MSESYHVTAEGKPELCKGRMFCRLGAHYSNLADVPVAALSKLPDFNEKTNSSLDYLNKGLLHPNPSDLSSLMKMKQDQKDRIVKKANEIRNSGGRFSAQDFENYSEKELRIIKIYVDNFGSERVKNFQEKRK